MGRVRDRPEHGKGVEKAAQGTGAGGLGKEGAVRDTRGRGEEEPSADVSAIVKEESSTKGGKGEGEAGEATKQNATRKRWWPPRTREQKHPGQRCPNAGPSVAREYIWRLASSGAGRRNEGSSSSGRLQASRVSW